MASRIRESAPWANGAKKTSGGYSGGPTKALLHATIAPSTALPGYNNQTTAPHITILWDPRRKSITPYQHYFWDNFAKALANREGGVETNRDSVLQAELAGYIGSTTPQGEFDILEAPEIYWEQVANELGPVWLSWGVEGTAPANWTTKGKLTYSQWDNFHGLCAHVHVPENDHWDLPLRASTVSLILSKVWGEVEIVDPPPVITVPPPTAPAFPYGPRHYFGPVSADTYCHSGKYSSRDRTYIRQIQAQLKTRGWTIIVDGFYGTDTKAVVTRFQREKGIYPDGLTGPVTWRSLWTAPIT